MPPIIALDCETYGLDSRRSPILQLGAVWTNEREEIIDRAEWNIIPESVTLPDESQRLHDPKALARNGIVMEEHLLTALPAAQVWEEFSLRFHRHRSVIQPFAVGFNIEGYDRGFLRQIGPIDDLFPYWSWVDLMHFVRTLTLGKGVFRYKGSLEGMAEALGVLIEGRAHTARRDAELTLLVHQALMKRITFQ